MEGRHGANRHRSDITPPSTASSSSSSRQSNSRTDKRTKNALVSWTGEHGDKIDSTFIPAMDIPEPINGEVDLRSAANHNSHQNASKHFFSSKPHLHRRKKHSKPKPKSNPKSKPKPKSKSEAESARKPEELLLDRSKHISKQLVHSIIDEEKQHEDILHQISQITDDLPLQFLLDNNLRSQYLHRAATIINRILSPFLINVFAYFFYTWKENIVKIREAEEQKRIEEFSKQRGASRLQNFVHKFEHKQIGKGFEKWKMEYLAAVKLESEAAACQLQRFVRGFLAKCNLRMGHFSDNAESLLILQCFIRQALARDKLSRLLAERLYLHTKATTIQNFVRSHLAKTMYRRLLRKRKWYEARMNAATMISKSIRGYLVRKQLTITRREELRFMAALTIQCLIRQHSARSKVLLRKNAIAEAVFAELMQALEEAEQEAAATRIQHSFEKYKQEGRRDVISFLLLDAVLVAEQHVAAVTIQRIFRHHQICSLLKEASLRIDALLLRSATTIQQFGRTINAKRQAAYRRMLRRLRLAAAVELQRVVRGFIGRRRAVTWRSQLTRLAVMLQRAFRYKMKRRLRRRVLLRFGRQRKFTLRDHFGVWKEYSTLLRVERLRLEREMKLQLAARKLRATMHNKVFSRWFRWYQEHKRLRLISIRAVNFMKHAIYSRIMWKWKEVVENVHFYKQQLVLVYLHCVPASTLNSTRHRQQLALSHKQFSHYLFRWTFTVLRTAVRRYKEQLQKAADWFFKRWLATASLKVFNRWLDYVAYSKYKKHISAQAKRLRKKHLKRRGLHSLSLYLAHQRHKKLLGRRADAFRRHQLLRRKTEKLRYYVHHRRVKFRILALAREHHRMQQQKVFYGWWFKYLLQCLEDKRKMRNAINFMRRALLSAMVQAWKGAVDREVWLRRHAAATQIQALTRGRRARLRLWLRSMQVEYVSDRRILKLENALQGEGAADAATRLHPLSKQQLLATLAKNEVVLCLFSSPWVRNNLECKRLRHVLDQVFHGLKTGDFVDFNKKRPRGRSNSPPSKELLDNHKANIRRAKSILSILKAKGSIKVVEANPAVTGIPFCAQHHFDQFPQLKLFWRGFPASRGAHFSSICVDLSSWVEAAHASPERTNQFSFIPVTADYDKLVFIEHNNFAESKQLGAFNYINVINVLNYCSIEGKVRVKSCVQRIVRWFRKTTNRIKEDLWEQTLRLQREEAAKKKREDEWAQVVWKQYVDEATGKQYYYNHKTGISRWTQPVDDEAFEVHVVMHTGHVFQVSVRPSETIAALRQAIFHCHNILPEDQVLTLRPSYVVGACGELIEFSNNKESTSKLGLGVVVEADFQRGGEWYRGVVVKVHDDESCDVQYDDGDFEEAVPRMSVRLPALLDSYTKYDEESGSDQGDDDDEGEEVVNTVAGCGVSAGCVLGLQVVAKSPEPPAALPHGVLCEFCVDNLALLRCRTCQDLVCVECYTAAHQSRLRSLHVYDQIEYRKVAAALREYNDKDSVTDDQHKELLLCNQCQVRECEVFCRQCSDGFCRRCQHLTHSKGNLVDHKALPLPLKPARDEAGNEKKIAFGLTAPALCRKYGLTTHFELLLAQCTRQERDRDLQGKLERARPVVRRAFDLYDTAESGSLRVAELKRVVYEELCEPVEASALASLVTSDIDGETVRFESFLEWLVTSTDYCVRDEVAMSYAQDRERLRAEKQERLAVLQKQRKAEELRASRRPQVKGYPGVFLLGPEDYDSHKYLFVRYARRVFKIETSIDIFNEDADTLERSKLAFNSTFVKAWNSGKLGNVYYRDNTEFRYQDVQYKYCFKEEKGRFIYTYQEEVNGKHISKVKYCNPQLLDEKRGELRTLFDMYDEEEEGELSRERVQHLIEDELCLEQSEEQSQHMLATLDPQGGDAIAFEPFLEWYVNLLDAEEPQPAANLLAVKAARQAWLKKEKTRGLTAHKISTMKSKLIGKSMSRLAFGMSKTGSVFKNLGRQPSSLSSSFGAEGWKSADVKKAEARYPRDQDMQRQWLEANCQKPPKRVSMLYRSVSSKMLSPVETQLMEEGYLKKDVQAAFASSSQGIEGCYAYFKANMIYPKDSSSANDTERLLSYGRERRAKEAEAQSRTQKVFKQTINFLEEEDDEELDEKY